MLFNDNVNRYNSSAKGVIDAWYKQNMINKTNKLEDTVYCNARNMINQSTNGWNKDGSLTITIQFKNYTLNNDLSCANETDQFAVGNNKAKLTYPVGLLQDEERNNINTLSLVGTEEDYWTFSPSYFEISSAGLRYVYSSGGSAYKYVDYSIGLRPVVSLRPDVVITEGTGSEADPWIVE